MAASSTIVARVWQFPWHAVARLILGMTLLISGLSKLDNPLGFLRSLYEYEIVGPPFGRYLAVVIPGIEVIVGICLLLGVHIAASSTIALVLLVAFVSAQISVLGRGLHIRCACFGWKSTAEVTVGTVFRTTLLLVLAGVCISSAWNTRRMR